MTVGGSKDDGRGEGEARMTAGESGQGLLDKIVL